MKLNFQKINKFGSIEKFLLIIVSILFTVYIGTAYLLGKYQTRHEVNEIFDPQLTHSAFLLFDLLGESVTSIDQTSHYLPVIYHNFGGRTEDKEFSAHHKTEDDDFVYENKFAYQVYNDSGKLLIRSSSAPNKPLSKMTEGFSSIMIGQEQWRVYSLYDKDLGFWLYVAEDEFLRNKIADEISAQIPLPALIITPLFLILIIVFIRIALAPLKELVSSINQQDIRSLSVMKFEVIPKEIKPVVEAINSLILRLEDALLREKRLTADTAHELRTPLSVVLIHAQNALNNHSEQQRNSALQALDTGIKRVARLLEQLLTLSKINPETMPRKSINLYQITQQTIAEMAIKVMQKDQEISLHCDRQTETEQCEGNTFLLEILMRNLIENASQYTPNNGEIKITISNVGQQFIFTIEDSGIGVEPEFYSKITERFYRQNQQQGKGAGLGLTLVNNIVKYHQGTINFEKSSLGGLQVNVTLMKALPPLIQQ